MAPDQSRSVRRHLWAAQLIAYLLIVALGFIGFRYAAGERDADAAASIERGREHRAVTAAVVCGVETLIIDLIQPPPDRKLTAEQKASLKRITERLARFRVEQLAALGVDPATVKECSR